MGRIRVNRAKPFCIAKREVWEAYKQVKANRGAAGIDGQTIEDFERDMSKNLYRIWNRMSSGSYFPPPVRRVDIPKGDSGKTRPLGIPAVADRIAQTVVKRYLEPILEPQFHKDSYGYRPGKSAHDALAVARQRCWQRGWVLDLDIESFFDRIDWELLMRAVRHHTDCKWVLLYIERWLKAPVSMPDGTLVSRERGSPQGSVISPVLANLFLHYAFDRWMQREHPDIPFERYADDAICHCRSEAQALKLRQALEQRLAECRLQLHPQKTKVVYCNDANRPGNYPERCFDFLGYMFRPRSARNRDGKRFVGYLLTLRFGHRKVARCPKSDLFHVLGDNREDPDHPITAQMHHQPFGRDGQQVDLAIARVIRIDGPVALEAREPVPTVRAHRFEIVQTAVPTVEADIIG